MIYRLAEPSDWRRAQETGTFVSADLAAEGFIHFSEAHQVSGTADRYYRNRGPMILIAVDETRLTARLVRENTRGGMELFPHVYGPVSLEAVVWTRELPMLPDGRLEIGEIGESV